MMAHEAALVPAGARSLKHYLARAFFLQYNVILLFGAALFSLASASAVPLVAGLGFEFVWLAVAPNLAVFRRWADGASAAADGPAAPDRDLEALGPAHASRLLAVRSRLRDIGARIAGAPGSELGDALARLPSLESRFVALCRGAQRLTHFLAETPQAALEQEVVRLNTAFSAETDLGVRLTIRQAINLAQRRANQRQHILSTRRTIEIELETLETSLGYLHAQALALGPTRELLRELDALFEQLSAPEALDADLAEALGPPTPSRV